MDGGVFVEDVHLLQPVGGVHEVVLGDVEREAVDGGDVEDIGDGLVVLVVFGADVADALVEVAEVEVNAVPLHLLGLVGEVVAAVALHLRDQQREVVGLELVGREDLGCGAVEVVLLCPRALPLRKRLVAVEARVVVYQVSVSVDLVVLVHVAVVSLAGLEDNRHRSFLFGEIEVVEGDD